MEYIPGSCREQLRCSGLCPEADGKVSDAKFSASNGTTGAAGEPAARAIESLATAIVAVPTALGAASGHAIDPRAASPQAPARKFHLEVSAGLAAAVDKASSRPFGTGNARVEIQS